MQTYKDLYNLLPKTYQEVLEDLNNQYSDQELFTIAQTMFRQSEKGKVKYGTTIDDCKEYNWLEMANEEYVDLLVYLKKAQKAGQLQNQEITFLFPTKIHLS